MPRPPPNNGVLSGFADRVIRRKCAPSFVGVTEREGEEEYLAEVERKRERGAIDTDCVAEE